VCVWLLLVCQPSPSPGCHWSASGLTLSLSLYRCFTLRSWVHEVFSRFGTVSPGLGDRPIIFLAFQTFSPGLEKIEATKCGSENFPRTVTYILCVEKCQNHILMHSCLPIPGRPVKNVMDSGSQSETYACVNLYKPLLGDRAMTFSKVRYFSWIWGPWKYQTNR
jgi:hypothetical protein